MVTQALALVTASTVVPFEPLDSLCLTLALAVAVATTGACVDPRYRPIRLARTVLSAVEVKLRAAKSGFRETSAELAELSGQTSL